MPDLGIYGENNDVLYLKLEREPTTDEIYLVLTDEKGEPIHNGYVLSLEKGREIRICKDCMDDLPDEKKLFPVDQKGRVLVKKQD